MIDRQHRTQPGLTPIVTWEHVQQEYPVGTTVDGTVAHRAVHGVFVDLPRGYLGLVEAPEIPGDEFPQVGETIRCKVLGYRERNQQLALSMRALDHD